MYILIILFNAIKRILKLDKEVGINLHIKSSKFKIPDILGAWFLEFDI